MRCSSSWWWSLTEEEARFTKNLSNVEGTETDSVKLICEVSKPEADVIWYKGDEELPEGGRYEHIVDGRRRILLIQDLKMPDAGEYNCRLSPRVRTSGNLRVNGTHTSSSGPMAVFSQCFASSTWEFHSFGHQSNNSFPHESHVFLSRPNFCFFSPAVLELAAEFLSRPRSIEVVEGEKAEFTCTVSKEAFEVKWQKDAQELEAGDKYQMISDGKRRTLVITNCELSDECKYLVTIGATRASAHLTVLGKE